MFVQKVSIITLFIFVFVFIVVTMMGNRVGVTLGDASVVSKELDDDYLEKPVDKEDLRQELPGVQISENGPCFVTGCSDQLCKDQQIKTHCGWEEAYSCISQSICERQAGGVCGWTISMETQICMQERKVADRIVNYDRSLLFE